MLPHTVLVTPFEVLVTLSIFTGTSLELRKSTKYGTVPPGVVAVSVGWNTPSPLASTRLEGSTSMKWFVGLAGGVRTLAVSTAAPMLLGLPTSEPLNRMMSTTLVPTAGAVPVNVHGAEDAPGAST